MFTSLRLDVPFSTVRSRKRRPALDRYARAQAWLEHAGGWAWRDRAASVVRGLGFGDADLDRPLRSFSGGELTRASLARALAGDPDLLLLDEPTNHLDIESLEWLEAHLQSLDAAIVLVAHDRWFLDAVGTAVLELEGGRARYFHGTRHPGRQEEAPPPLAGARELDGGKLRRGHNVKLGLLSQHAEELGSAGTVLEATQRATGLKPNPARALLGRFLFSGEEAEKPLDGLSGGERRRLSLAILVHSGANVLILDEPTNHLDLESREALERALDEFKGSLLLVSHDRALLDAVGKRTVAFEDRTLRSYVGGWPEYVRVRDERAREAAAKPAAAAHPSKTAPNRAKARPKRPAQPRKRAVDEQRLEREI